VRVLLLHHRYRATGGEERAVEELAALLVRRGHTVARLERSSARIGRLHAGASLIEGGWRPDQVSSAVRRVRAQIVHAHNLHPTFGWRALAAARAAGAGTILQLHNFRLFCAIGVAYRDGAPCFRCRQGDTWPGLALRCRGSLGEAAVYAVGLRRAQPRLLAHADRFLVLSEAHGRRLRELGLPAARSRVLPNFVPAATLAAESRAAEGKHALVAGRLVEEKGFDTAIAAARASGVPLVVAGAGPDETRLRALARGAPVRFTGWVSALELARLRRAAGVALVPSRCEEACPYALLEASAAGVPALVSDRGGLPELSAQGTVLPPDDVEAWAQTLRELWASPGRRAALGAGALALAATRLGEERYHSELIAVYEEALQARGPAR
jgi:glycosyltransferase involved in cell wall biosynthesis